MAPDPSRWHRRSRCTPLFWLAGARSPARMYGCSDRSNRTTYTIATEGQLSACTDTPSWLAAGEGCEQYAARRCSRGSLLAAAAAAAAAAAVQHCCLCGKWREAVAASTPTCWDGALEDPGVPWGSSAFCPAWPSQNRSQLPTPTRALVRTAVRVALRPFASRGIRREQIREALAQRCAQRLCLHVQIRRGAVYVVAPSSRACRRPPCGHSSLRGEHWPTAWSPSSLEWHLAAGLNVSTCSTGVRRGDYNGPFTRLRLLTALRLLHESAARGAADTELALCAGEVAINAGGWCLKGQQPVFASTTNEQHALLPFVHWMAGLRDFEFAVWDEVRNAQRKADWDALHGPRAAAAAGRAARAAAAAGVPASEASAAVAAAAGPMKGRAPAAAFRGGVFRLASYSAHWRREGAARTPLDASNWRHVGRTALLRCKLEAGGELLNVHVRHAECGARCSRWAQALQVPPAVLAAMDEPPVIPFREQVRRFAYSINAEGHGGWADRLYQLLLAPTTVLAQDLPFRLWYELPLRPGRHFAPVDAALTNLSRAVAALNANPKEAAAMARRANWAMRHLASTAGIRAYVDELLARYTRLLQGALRLDPRAVEFSCRPTGECRECLPPGSSARRSVCGTRCAFVVASKEYATLHEASQAMGFGRGEAGQRPLSKNASRGSRRQRQGRSSSAGKRRRRRRPVLRSRASRPRRHEREKGANKGGLVVSWTEE